MKQMYQYYQPIYDSNTTVVELDRTGVYQIMQFFKWPRKAGFQKSLPIDFHVTVLMLIYKMYFVTNL